MKIIKYYCPFCGADMDNLVVRESYCLLFRRNEITICCGKCGKSCVIYPIEEHEAWEGQYE